MPSTRDFFQHKKEWSKLKDEVLSKYLAPYLSKITSSRRPTRIIDCFAGRGKFEDGQPGSPIIIKGLVMPLIERSPDLDLKAIFIEKKYARDLRSNLGDDPHLIVIDGEYEDFVTSFVSSITDINNNTFFYVDPYGIKSIDFIHFRDLSSLGLTSLEILLNFNTTGFLREGCHILKLTRAIPDWALEHEEEDDETTSTKAMNDIAGGDYWQDILDSFQHGGIDFHTAEQLFTDHYATQLRSVFKHVVNIPIMQRSYHIPKYRLIFMTNYYEGLHLMANQMNQTWRHLLENESNGQLSLFSEEEQQEREGNTIIDKIWRELETPKKWQDLLSLLIEHNGIAHTWSEYSNTIKLNDALFEISRNPPVTKTGKPSKSMDYKERTIIIRRVTHSN